VHLRRPGAGRDHQDVEVGRGPHLLREPWIDTGKMRDMLDANRLILETLLGLTLEAEKLRLAPCIPAAWTTYTVHYRYRDTIYDITVVQLDVPGGQSVVTLDGVEQRDLVIPLVDDRAHHTVEMRLHRVPA